MAWEERERGTTRYYTRSRKVGGRVIREYVGSGPLAEIAAQQDALDRLRREEEARLLREERERLEVLDRETRELNDLAELLTHAALLVAGYRQHERGEWRRPRERE
jgi:hypothetical protein